MSDNEQERISSASSWYLQQQLDFDKRLVGFRYQSLKPYLTGAEGLELGPAEGEMTQFLRSDFGRLTVVEGAQELLDLIPDYANVIKVRSLFEDFAPAQTFDTIIMEHILEHVDDPVALIARARAWLAPQGRMLLGVPNGNSFHRLAAVKMGLLSHQCELNARDVQLGHRRVYTPDSFRKDIEAAGMRVQQMGGVFFKPLSNQQIQDHWTEDMIRAFYEMGKDFPDHAAEIYAVCELP